MQLLSAGLLHHTKHVVAVQTMDGAHHHHGDVLGTAQTMDGTHRDASQFQSVCDVVSDSQEFVGSCHMFRTSVFTLGMHCNRYCIAALGNCSNPCCYMNILGVSVFDVKLIVTFVDQVLNLCGAATLNGSQYLHF